MNAIFISVRSASTRLPRKCFRKVGGKAAIEQVIDRAKGSKKAKGIVLCTTNEFLDAPLCYIANKNEIVHFRGSTEDKLDRWNRAASNFGITKFVTFDGDDLLCSPFLADLAFEQMDKTKADFIDAPNVPCGAFTYGIRVSALNYVCEIKGTSKTEMMVPYFTETGIFKVEHLQGVPKELQRPEIRMTLDYEDDLKFFQNIYDHFRGKKIKLPEVIKYLDENPEVREINNHCQQEYLDNQKVLTKMELR